MTPWWEERMLAIDVETTAPDPEDARIVSLALVAVGGGKPTDPLTMLVNPGVEIPQEAIDVHGITNEQVAAHGKPLGEALAVLAGSLLAAHRLGWPVVAHNARYDLTVGDREARRHGGDSARIVLEVLPQLIVIDPLVIERHHDRYRPKAIASHSLEDCCRVWRVPLGGVAHDAAFDAISAARLVYQLARKGKIIRRTRDDQERREFVELTQEWERVRQDPVALFEWQRRIAWDESERLEAYFHAGDRRKGVPPQPDRVVPREWPIIPVGKYPPRAPNVRPIPPRTDSFWGSGYE